MKKENLIQLLDLLEDNDCLHSEWEWYTENENGEVVYTVDWVLDWINQNTESYVIMKDQRYVGVDTTSGGYPYFTHFRNAQLWDSIERAREYGNKFTWLTGFSVHRVKVD